jgi:hypothetical protein
LPKYFQPGYPPVSASAYQGLFRDFPIYVPSPLHI